MIVGVLGGGQLARMLALAGHPLGLRFIFLDPAPGACAAPLGEHLCAAFDDEAALATLAERADVVTYEFENVPAQAVRLLSGRVPVYPSAAALAETQDRLREKRLFRALDIGTPSFLPVDTPEALEAAVAEIGLPAVLKPRSQGYDGKGQAVLRRAADLEAAWKRLGGASAILEAFVRFRREISIIAVRCRDGETRFYPVAENTHSDGILRRSLSRAGDPLQKQAEDYAGRLIERLDYVGVFTLELFDTGEGLLANEFAPRVHNSGHWTIEGAETSQFENHLRAILGLPPGSTEPVGHAAMLNFIGEHPDPARFLAIPGAHLHVYGKEPLAGRKVGHGTLRSATERGLQAALERARESQLAGTLL